MTRNTPVSPKLAQRQYFRLFLLFSSCVILTLMAFSPLDLLNQTLFTHSKQYNDILLNALHFPGVWLFYGALSLFLPRWWTIGIVFTAIVTVELVQLKVGRTASMLDVSVGTLGLIAGASTLKSQLFSESQHKYSTLRKIMLHSLRWFCVGIYAVYFGQLLLQRYQVMHFFPRLDHFDNTHLILQWRPIEVDDQASSKLQFIQPSANESKVMLVNKTQNTYWGAGFRVYHNLKDTAFSQLVLCIQASAAAQAHIRMDDRIAATYHERLNLEIQLSTEFVCHELDLRAAVQKLQQTGTTFVFDDLINVAVFLPPAEPGASSPEWFRISQLYLQ